MHRCFLLGGISPIATSVADAKKSAEFKYADQDVFVPDSPDDPSLIRRLEEEMWNEAEALNFEKAASIRDRVEELRLNAARRKRFARTRKRNT